MRIPSTSDLVQAHSNRAYDKMEVISDHIHEIMELYDWIFNLREYLASKLAMYVSLANDELISGQKSFLKTLRAPTLRLASIVESLTDESEFTIGEYNGDPALLITFSQEIDDDTVVGTVAMAINRATSTPYFAIPPTKADESTSAVRLDYLNQVIATLGSGSDALTGRVTAIENQLANVLPLDTSPTEGSHKGVTSNGIWVAIRNAINDIDFPEVPETVFPIATTEQKGIMQVGDYLTVNDGLVGVDVASLREALGLGGTSSVDTWTVLTGNITTPSTALTNRASDWDSVPWCHETTASFIKGQTGTTNSFLTPAIEYSFTDLNHLTPANLRKGVNIGTTITCKNTSTNVIVKYVPVRTVGYLADWDVSAGGSSEGGLRYTVTICAFYRKSDYTLSATDIAEINAEATAFLSDAPDRAISLYGYSTVIYDTGALE